MFVTFISIHLVIICVVFLWRTYEMHRLYPLNPGVTHPRKTNVVANVLSCKAQCHFLTMDSHITTLCNELSKFSMEVVPPYTLDNISVEPILQDQIIIAQLSDKGFQIIKLMLSQKLEKYKFLCQYS
jgi:hypothetical protein